MQRNEKHEKCKPLPVHVNDEESLPQDIDIIFKPFNFCSFLVRVPFLKTAVRDSFCTGTRSVLSFKRPFAIRFSAGVNYF